MRKKPCGPVPGGGMTSVIIIAAWVCVSAPLALAIGKMISFGMREDRQDRKEAVSCSDLKAIKCIS
jgi:hypothetical protein